MSGDQETYEFQTEARQLLDLMVHSIYSNKDIFLRELISNASDALDKLRFEGVRNPALLDGGEAPRILITRDAEARILWIDDNGIGMSREEVKELIGTIAKSGTRAFLDKLRDAKENGVPPELIGQFGVGFYSTFMVAGSVSLLTRRAGEKEATLWESAGDGRYTLSTAERAMPGTTVTLRLKPADSEDGLHDYTEEWKIREIVKQYSDFVAYPIQMDIERREIERDESGKPVEGAEEQTVVTRETLNSMKAIWLRSKDEISEEEYNEFYKHISHDWTDPMRRIQAKFEGTLEYRMLLYIPARAPFDLFYRGESRHGVHLYVRRVFIMDDCAELLPEYLRFIRGIVDSEDLSLNISREILQQNRQIQRMRNGIAGKILDELKDMSDKNPAQYETFWAEFGKVLKEGLFQDPERQETLLGLMRAASTHSDTGLTTMDAYVDRMAPGQEAIYYMTGESQKKIAGSPHLEAFRAKGYEVLLLSDPVDEVWTQSVFEYKGKRLQSAGKGAVDLGTEEEKKEAEEKRQEKQQEYGPLFDCLKKFLDEHVKEVRLSNRLTESAACLVTGDHDMTPQVEKLIRAMGQEVPEVKRILEVNAGHPIIEKLHAIYSSDASDARLEEYATLLYGQAVLAEGGQLPDPSAFSRLVAKLMTQTLA